MYFNTKKELLVYLGKNEKDTKLIDRMIKRGEVIKDANGYTLVEIKGKKENKSDIEYSKLENQIKQLKDDLNVAEVNAEYYKAWAICWHQRVKYGLSLVYDTNVSYFKGKKIEKADFINQLMGEMKEKYEGPKE